MKHKIKKQYEVEIPIIEIVEVLKKAGVLPVDMKPEHNIHAGGAVIARVTGPARAQCLTIAWQETEEIGKDGLKKKGVVVDTVATLRAGRKKKR